MNHKLEATFDTIAYAVVFTLALLFFAAVIGLAYIVVF